MDKHERHRRKLRYAGFTLIELSLVLVIIGLIVGGVLVGRDLIASSQMRAQVTQFEKFNAAVNTFRAKFSALPGDITAAQAATFGFTTRSGTNDGDGDFRLEGCSVQNEGNTNGAGPIYGSYGCETALLWADLSQAGLSEFNLIFTNTNAVIPLSVTSLPLSLPSAKLGSGNYITVYNDNQYNHFVITNLIAATGSYSTPFTSNFITTPSQTYALDSKIDDGMPTTGSVISSMGYNTNGYCWWLNGSNPGSVCGNLGADACINNTTPATYRKATTPSCSALIIRFQ